MCVPGCYEAVVQRLESDRISRRGFFKGVGAASAAAAAFHVTTVPSPVRAAPSSFTDVLDLTHVIAEDFPTYFGTPQLEMERLNSFAEHGFNMFKWHLTEHTGTHLDAPIHFSADGASADEIPVANLVVPLVVVDIAVKAQDDADYRVTPDDLTEWESANGPLPVGACVAMHSGWDKHVQTEKFRNADSDGLMHFPGFHVEAAEMMIEKGVGGMAVDTLSLDYGASKDFVTHYKWLPSGRWGMECIANLAALPAAGATLVVGSPKIKGSTGGPSRLFALV